MCLVWWCLLWFFLNCLNFFENFLVRGMLVFIFGIIMKLLSHHLINDVKIFEPTQYHDQRGVFVETWNEYAVVEYDGVKTPITDTDIGPFVQDNHSVSTHKYTIRGLHAQKAPHAHGKLVRVVHGSIMDVAVDARKESATYGQYVVEHLSSKNWKQLWIPPGFLHGFITLEPETSVAYKLTTPYCKDSEVSIAWDSPDLRINWQVHGVDDIDVFVLSDKDRAAPKFIHGQFFL